MPAKTKRTRVLRSDETKAEAVARVLNGESQRVVADEIGCPHSNISKWVKEYRAGNLHIPKGKTMVSNGHVSERLPVSGPVSVRGPLPPLPPAPTVTLAGLEEYINAIVDRRVAEQFKLRLRMMDQVG